MPNPVPAAATGLPNETPPAKRGSRSFMDLESDINDVVRMSQLAEDAAEKAVDEAGENATEGADLALFAAHQVRDRLEALKAAYYKAWEGAYGKH